MNNPSHLEAQKVVKKKPAGIYPFLLASLMLVLIGTNVYWVIRNTAPPSWDPAWYLENARYFYDSLVDHGPGTLFDVFSRSFKTKAPLISLLPLPAFMIFQPNAVTAQLFLSLLIIPMAIFQYLLFKEVTDRRTAILGAVFTSSMPVMFGLSRQFMVEYGLTVIVVMWMYFLITSDHLKKRKNDLALGILLGLGLLMKVNFPIYVVVPSAIVLVNRLRRDSPGGWMRLFIDGSLILIPGIALAGTWYAHNLSSVVRHGLSSGYGSWAESHYMSPMQFFRSAINDGLSTYLFAVLVMLAALTLATRHRNVFKKIVLEENHLVLASWFIVPFLILAFSVNRDVRFLTPALPVIGLAIASLFFKNVSRKAMLPALMLSVIPLFNLIYTTYPLGERIVHIANFKIISHAWGDYAGRPENEDWLIEDVLEDVNQDARNQPKKLTIIVDNEYYNLQTMAYYSSLKNYDIELATTAYLPAESSSQQIQLDLSQADYILATTGVPGPPATNYRNEELLSTIKESPGFRLMKEYVLPGGATALVFKNQRN